MVDTCQAATLFSQVCNLRLNGVMFLEISLTQIIPNQFVLVFKEFYIFI